jgi:hypothetical protein
MGILGWRIFPTIYILLICEEFVWDGMWALLSIDKYTVKPKKQGNKHSDLKKFQLTISFNESFQTVNGQLTNVLYNVQCTLHIDEYGPELHK